MIAYMLFYLNSSRHLVSPCPIFPNTEVFHQTMSEAATDSQAEDEDESIWTSWQVRKVSFTSAFTNNDPHQHKLPQRWESVETSRNSKPGSWLVISVRTKYVKKVKNVTS